MIILYWLNATIIFFLRIVTIVIAFSAGVTLRAKVIGDGLAFTAIPTSKIFWTYSLLCIAGFTFFTCIAGCFSAERRKKIIVSTFVTLLCIQIGIGYYYHALLNHPEFYTLPHTMEPITTKIIAKISPLLMHS